MVALIVTYPMLIAGTSQYGVHCATMPTEVFNVCATYSLGFQHLVTNRCWHVRFAGSSTVS
jgi:hypothetical protein